MPVEVILPKVDMDMAKGRIVAWHVAEGEAVAKGDPLFDIETEKAAMEVESPGAGTLRHVTAPEGTEVPIGAAVAWIYAEGEPVDDAPPGGDGPAARRGEGDDAETPDARAAAAPGEGRGPREGDGPSDDAAPIASGGAPDGTPGDPREPRAHRSDAEVAEAPSAGPPADAAPPGTAAGRSDRPRATPAARKLAAERGVALSALNGSGPRGRVQRADVEARCEAPAPSPAATPEKGDALSVLSTGEGEGVPWVMIHGLAGDASAWAGLAEALGRGAPVHRIELPNHGRSPRRPVADFADLARRVRPALDALGDGPVRLLGHSLGGAVALALADVRPRRVAELTLIAPAGLGPRIDGPTLAGLVRASRAESLGPWLKELVADPDAISWNYVQAAMMQRSDPELRAAQAEMADALFPDGVQPFDLRAALERLRCPARIVWGRRDRIIPWEHALRAPGHVALHLFEGVGHLPHIERPDALRRLLA